MKPITKNKEYTILGNNYMTAFGLLALTLITAILGVPRLSYWSGFFGLMILIDLCQLKYKGVTLITLIINLPRKTYGNTYTNKKKVI